MATTRNIYVATAGQTQFDLTFPYISRTDVSVRVGTQEVTDFTFVTATRVQLATPAIGGERVVVYRRTPVDAPRVNFAANSILTDGDLNDNQTQLLYRLQESEDLLDGVDVEGAAAAAELAQEAAAEAVGATINKLNKVEYPVIRDILPLAGDGVTNCAAALSAVGQAFITLPPGNFRVSTNVTIDRPIYFAPGSRMTVDAGVTVTFTGKGQVTSDCRRQIFYGPGAILGLRLVDETWFVGDKLYALDFDYITHDVTTPLGLLGPNADVELQRAANAVRENGKYLAHSGVLSLSGEVLIAFNQQVEIVGDVRTSLYIWTSLKTNGFALNKQRSKYSGIWFRKYAMDQYATEGVALYVNSSQVQANNFMISGAYVGVSQQNQAGGFYSTFEIYGSKASAFALTNVNDTAVGHFVINGGDELGTFAPVSGTWSNVQYGDQLTGSTSGAKFVARHINPAGKMYMAKNYQNAAFPVIGEVFTNARTGATATLTGFEYSHDQAGMCLYQTAGSSVLSNLAEGAFVTSGDIIGGYRSLLVLGSGVGYREGPSFNGFTNVFFDSAIAEGIKIEKADGVRFVGGWLAARGNGFNIQDARQVTFSAMDIRDSDGYAGLLQGQYSTAIDFTDCYVVDNRAGVHGTTGSQVRVSADFQGTINIKGGRWGKSVSTRHSTDTALEFLGTSAKFVAIGTTFRTTRQFPIGGLFGLAQYWVQGCDGARMKSRVATTIPTGQSSVTLAHGLPFTPDPSVALVNVNSGNGWGGGVSAYVSAATATTFTVTLQDKDGNVFPATKNVNVLCTLDQSYNGIN